MKWVISIHEKIFSELNVRLFEKNIMFLAIGGFIIHLLFILLEGQLGVEIFSEKTNLSSNPISALYTPFTFILVYEAFFLIFQKIFLFLKYYYNSISFCLFLNRQHMHKQQYELQL